MRHVLLLILLLWGLFACEQNKVSAVTVLLFDNQHPRAEVTVDTLLKAKNIDLSITPIDLFFVCKNFHLPYYVPTDGLVKNAAKDKECDMGTYPRTVKCYQYDTDNRVIEMTVNGSGTMNDFIYKYNDRGQIIEVTDNGDKFTLAYNADGTLAALTEKDMLFEKKAFIYLQVSEKKPFSILI